VHLRLNREWRLERIDRGGTMREISTKDDCVIRYVIIVWYVTVLLFVARRVRRCR
jgi:hypothetical protein